MEGCHWTTLFWSSWSELSGAGADQDVPLFVERM
jgi:hypothetical protein